MASVRSVQLALDFREQKEEALRYQRNNPDVNLGDFLRLYSAWARESLPADYFHQPLKHFQITPITLRPGTGVELTPPGPAGGQLRKDLDELHAADVARAKEGPVQYPADLRDGEAVKIAYRHELEAVARYLKNSLSVLIVCDKILAEHVYEYVCQQAGRMPVLDDAAPQAGSGAPSGPGAPGGGREALDRAMQGNRGGIEQNLPLLIGGLKEGQVLVLRSVDLLNTPPLIEVLYEGTSGGRKPQLLGFLDPSLEAKKVLTDRFAIRVGITGLPRYIQPDRDKEPLYTVTRLITAQEAACFENFDPEGLYKNVSGLNAIQFRNAMRYVGAEVAPKTPSRKIYEVIRQFKTSSSDEIEIPDTTFEDIGGYESIKQELQRIVALTTGQVAGIDERERQNLVPRGFIFHGPPGTGKTLFAKAIANEMHATIQMVSGPEIMDKYVGQSESNLRHIFHTARRNAPSVIFFDEFDSIAGQRSNYSDGGARANNAVVAQLLTELDGFREDQAVLVIGTSNRLDIIDEALLRPSRLRPIEISLPNYVARRSVASIHARKFGVDRLLADLCRTVLEHLGAWKPDGPPPATFLDALFAQHPPYKKRYEAETQRAGFLRQLEGLCRLVRQAQSGAGPAETTGPAPPQLAQIEHRVVELARGYGIDLAQPDRPSLSDPQAAVCLEPMQTDLRDLFGLIQEQKQQSGGFSPETFVSGVIDLIAEYSEGFNNDEIRAVFQESSLEHHLEGHLVTPRGIGLKIGLIRKRRDERQVVHLSPTRGQH